MIQGADTNIFDRPWCCYVALRHIDGQVPRYGLILVILNVLSQLNFDVENGIFLRIVWSAPRRFAAGMCGLLVRRRIAACKHVSDLSGSDTL